MKMTTMDDIDIERALQEELDALSLDETLANIDDDDDDVIGNETEAYHHIDERAGENLIEETRAHLERAMKERLAAFENEINKNFKRYEIDYDEIDDLLKKPIGNIQEEIEINVAKNCGIEREELNQILRSINAEAAPMTQRTDMNEDDDESDKENHLEEEKTPRVETKQSLSSSITSDQSIETTPRQQEDPNIALHNERLAESHRRMLDELALLEQRRKEEEERYAAVLQEQQARLAEEYRRLQETLDENIRQTQQEKLQFESLRREQDLVLHERQMKMATIIQAWYRGKRIYRQYHPEIVKRTMPILKSIEKKRKKKEQEARANAMKLEKIQEATMNEKENHIEEVKSEPSTAPPPVVKPVPVMKSSTVKEDSTTKKKKPKPSSITNVPQPPPPPSRPLPMSAQIVQMEDPADFVPTVYPEPRTIVSPRSILSPRPPAEPRPKSSQKFSMSARIESPRPRPTPISTVETKIIPEQKLIEISRPLSASLNQYETVNFEPAPPLPVTPMPTEESRPASAVLKRSTTITIEPTAPLPATPVPNEDSRPPSALLKRSITMTKEPTVPLSVLPMPIEQSRPTSASLKRSVTITKEPTISSPIIPVPTDQSRPASASLKRSETITLEPSSSLPTVTVLTPRPRTPRKAAVTKTDPSFLIEARQWARRTEEITFTTLLHTSEENLQQMPNRRPGGNIRKLPDLDINLLSKLTKNQVPNEVSYLVLEQLTTPCSLSLIGTQYLHLTHLTLRQCKLGQLTGLDACPLLRILDIENNWLEQIHLQSSHLEYLNMSRNRVTSLLSIQTPQLKYLNASNNRLTRLNGLETFINLNILLATSNQLLTTIGLQGCTRLLHLDLSDNHLVEMDQLDQCPLLIIIKATSNALIQLPNLSNAILLHELDLSSNSLNTFDDLFVGGWLPFLTHLKLKSNAIQELASIRLPALKELDLAYNQLSDVSMLKNFLEQCPTSIRLDLEQNPVLHDMTPTNSSTSFTNPISLLPRSVDNLSTPAIESYLEFLSNITSMFTTLRQTIEQYQIEPHRLLKSIHEHCEEYSQAKKISIQPPAPVPVLVEVEPEPKLKPPVVVSEKEKNVIRIQSHWRRRLIEQQLKLKHLAAQIIQARWRGYIVRRRMQAVRHLFSHQSHQMYDEVDLTEFDFDEAAFDARFERPRTPAAAVTTTSFVPTPLRVRQVWQHQPEILSTRRTTNVYEPPLQNTSRTSSAASSRAKPLVEPLSMPKKTEQITNEWGFTPTSTTAALMLKRAEKMKWNAERRQKREHMDAYQRLQMARQHELPPGSLRLAKRGPAAAHTTKTLVQTQKLSPPSTGQSRSGRVFEWVHTQVARLDESPMQTYNSPRNERKRLPSLDGSTDSHYRGRSSDPFPPPQPQRWSASTTVSVRQPPPLLPPIIGHHPRI